MAFPCTLKPPRSLYIPRSSRRYTRLSRAFAMSFNRQGIALNAVMLAALTATVAGAIGRFVPTWQPGYLVAACFLVAIEAGIVHTIFRAERMWMAELARYLV